MSNVLDRIVATKREEIAAAQAARPADELQRAVADAPPPRDFLAALSTGGGIRLIAECLDDATLRLLHDQTLELGMTPLVEFYQPENLDRVVAAGARLIGVNNRDLRTFQTDLEHTIRMRARLPDECVLVGESGIHSRADALRLEAAGVQAILVGEHLMATPDIGTAVDRLLGRCQ
jgi:indole-3-glycerol phosphate synthase